MARDSNVWIEKVEKYSTIRVAKTKALKEAGLRLCFRLCRLLVFSCEGSHVFQVLQVQSTFEFNLPEKEAILA